MGASGRSSTPKQPAAAPGGSTSAGPGAGLPHLQSLPASVIGGRCACRPRGSAGEGDGGGGAVARGGAAGRARSSAGDRDERSALRLQLPRRLLLSPPGRRFLPGARAGGPRGNGARAPSRLPLSPLAAGPQRLPEGGRRPASPCAPASARRPRALSGDERDLPEPQRPGGRGRLGRRRRGRPGEPQPRAGHVAGLLRRGRAAGCQRRGPRGAGAGRAQPVGVARGADRCALRAVAHCDLRRVLPGLQPAHQVGEHDQLSDAGAPALQGRGSRHPGAVLRPPRPAIASPARQLKRRETATLVPRTGSAAAAAAGLAARGTVTGPRGPPGPGHRGTRGGGAGRDFNTRLVLWEPRRGGARGVLRGRPGPRSPAWEFCVFVGGRGGGSCGRIRVAALVGLILLSKRNLVIKLQPSGFPRLPTRTSAGCVCLCVGMCVAWGTARRAVCASWAAWLPDCGAEPWGAGPGLLKPHSEEARKAAAPEGKGLVLQGGQTAGESIKIFGKCQSIPRD